MQSSTFHMIYHKCTKGRGQHHFLGKASFLSYHLVLSVFTKMIAKTNMTKPTSVPTVIVTASGK